MLSCAEVAKALSPLAGYAEDVEDLVNSGPRHKSLRPYLDIITEFLDSMPSSRKKLKAVRLPIGELERTPSTGPESGTHAPLYMPAEAAGYSIPVEDGGGAVRRAPGYASLIALLAGIGYFSYALLVKYGLMKPRSGSPFRRWEHGQAPQSQRSSPIGSRTVGNNLLLPLHSAQHPNVYPPRRR